MAFSRKVILFIAISLDGYIAKSNDDLSFLSLVEEEGQDYGYSEFVEGIDTVIMGRRTYDYIMNQVTGFPHHDKISYIITRQTRENKDNIVFYSRDLKDLVLRLKSEKGKNIFVDGGAEIVNELLMDELIDEFYISIIPVMLGEGIRLFNDGRPGQILELISSKQFKKGLVQLHYRITGKK